jgi:hypothetical protein
LRQEALWDPLFTRKERARRAKALGRPELPVQEIVRSRTTLGDRTE